MVKSKRAWIRIVEAFVAILLIIGVLLMVVNQYYFEKEDISPEVYKIELSILREVQLNDALRNDILNTNPPVEWDDFDSRGLENLKTKIISRIPDYLNCEAKICGLDEVCILNEVSGRDVYAQSVTISANLVTYNPKQLKLFCWIEEK